MTGTELSDSLAFFVAGPKLVQAIMYLDKRTHLEAVKARSTIWFDIRNCRATGAEVFFDKITPLEMPWVIEWQSKIDPIVTEDPAISGIWDESWDPMMVEHNTVVKSRVPISLRGLTIAASISSAVFGVLMNRAENPERTKISIDHLIIHAEVYPDQINDADLSLIGTLQGILAVFCQRLSGYNDMWAAYIPDLFSERCIKRLEFTGNLWRSDARAQRKQAAIAKLDKIPKVCEFHAESWRRKGLVLKLERIWSYSQSDLHVVITALKLPTMAYP